MGSWSRASPGQRSGPWALRPQPAWQFCPASWHMRACVASAAASAGQVQASEPARVRGSLPACIQSVPYRSLSRE